MGMGMFDGAAVEQRRKALRYHKSPTARPYYHRRAVAEPVALLTIKVLTWQGWVCAAVLLNPRETQPHASD